MIKIPLYEDCQAKVDGGETLTPLEKFVLEYDIADAEKSDTFLKDLADVISFSNSVLLSLVAAQDEMIEKLHKQPAAPAEYESTEVWDKYFGEVADIKHRISLLKSQL